MVCEGRMNMPVIGLAILPAPGVDAETSGGQGGGDIILCGKGIRCADRDLRSARPQGLGELRGLTRHVQATAHPQAAQRPFLQEPRPDLRQDRHEAAGPVNPGLAGSHQGAVGDVGRH